MNIRTRLEGRRAAHLAIAQKIADRMAVCKRVLLGMIIDRTYRGNQSRDPRTTESQKSFFRGQGRLNDGADPQLNASAQDFVPCGTLRRNDSQLPNMTNDMGRTSDLKE